jgi:mannose-6-phosphate isomerase-like protein (cupin superfamily)
MSRTPILDTVRRAALVASLLLPTGCETIFPGFSLIEPDPPPPLPALADATPFLAAEAPSDPWRITLLDDREELSVHLVRVTGKIEPHVHRESDETFYLLTGSGDLLLEREWRPITAGMLVHIPRNTPHAFHNKAEGGSTALVTYTPRFLEGDRESVPYDPEKPQ